MLGNTVSFELRLNTYRELPNYSSSFAFVRHSISLTYLALAPEAKDSGRNTLDSSQDLLSFQTQVHLLKHKKCSHSIELNFHEIKDFDESDTYHIAENVGVG